MLEIQQGESKASFASLGIYNLVTTTDINEELSCKIQKPLITETIIAMRKNSTGDCRNTQQGHLT